MGIGIRAFWRGLTGRRESRAIMLLLAAAVGAASGLVTALDALVLHPLGVPDERRIVHLGGLATPVVGDTVEWWSQAATLEGLAIYRSGTVDVEGIAGQDRARVAAVSAGFFSVLGAATSRGRWFTSDDERAAERVMILSSAFWRRNFGVGAEALGARLRLNGILHEVVGIAPPGLDFPGVTEVWIPRTLPTRRPLFAVETDASVSRRSGWIGRLRRGVNQDQARAELLLLLRRLQVLYTAKTGVHFGDTATVLPLRTIVSERIAGSVWYLAAGAVLFLGLTAANCGTFFLGRMAGRRGEIAVRQVLGATPRRILLQLGGELALFGLAAGLLGGALGIGAVVGAMRLLSAYWIHEPALPRVIALTGGAALLLSMVSVLPASIAASIDAASWRVADAIRDASMTLGARGTLVRKTLVTGQVAVAVVLANAAIVSVLTFRSQVLSPLGFEPKGVLAARVSLPSTPDTTPGGDPSVWRDVLERTVGVPGVTTAGLTSWLPSQAGDITGAWIEHQGLRVFCPYTVVGGAFFGTLHIPLVAGREFYASDKMSVILGAGSIGSPQAVTDILGKLVHFDGESDPREVIGIGGRVSPVDGVDQGTAQCYLPYSAPYRRTADPTMWVVARCEDCAAVIPRLGGELRRAGVTLSAGVLRLADLVESKRSPAKARSILFSAFGVLGLGAAIAGVYALVYYLASLRTFEMGVRSALGAAPADTVWLLASEGVTLGTAGAILGTLASLAIAATAQSAYFGLARLDAGSLLTAAAVAVVGVGLAAVVPALRASHEPAWDTLRR